MTVAQVVGTGSYLPGAPVTNEQICQVFGRGVRQLCGAVGVQNRHWALDPDNGWQTCGPTNSEMAAEAVRRALDDAGLSAADVDTLFMVTATPDYPFPATVTLVQESLGIKECVALELRAACAGVTHALALATLLIRSGDARVAVVIGSELSSALLDMSRTATSKGPWSDDFLLSAIMFGDGAGAVVLAASDADDDRQGVFATLMKSVGGDRPPGFLCRVGGSRQPFSGNGAGAGDGHFLAHDFRAILDNGPRLVLRALSDLGSVTGLAPDQFDLIIPPQANPTLIRHNITKGGFDERRVFWNVARVGNTSSASLLIALDDARRQQKIKHGDRVALLGAEASKWLYGAAAFTWTRA
jgi:3-oxoacyl-[acyl-carrier-protein] synthase-3